MHIREATENDIPFLSDLRRRSLGHWPEYTNEWIAKNICNIRIPSNDLFLNEQMFVLLENDLLVGFYKFVYHGDGIAQLVDFYLDPLSIGRGLGQYLWDDFVERARYMDCTSITIESNPHAEGFYKKQGACRTGEVRSVDLHIKLSVQL